jgi:hypothetical protein
MTRQQLNNMILDVRLFPDRGVESVAFARWGSEWFTSSFFYDLRAEPCCCRAREFAIRRNESWQAGRSLKLRSPGFSGLFSGDVPLLPRQIIVIWLVPEHAVFRFGDVK